jgi:hypothetical protein
VLSHDEIKAATTMLAERVQSARQIPEFCEAEGIDAEMLADVAAMFATRLIQEINLPVDEMYGEDGIDPETPQGEVVSKIAQGVVQTLLLGLVAGMRSASEAKLPDIDNLTDEHDG